MSKRNSKSTHGFRGLKNSQVYIGKVTMSKPEPRDTVISIIKDIWNNDPAAKKLRKHITKLTITKNHTSARTVLSGTYCTRERKVIIRDYSGVPAESYRQVFYHEVVGHAFWMWAKTYRNEAWTNFNRFVSTLRPINGYVKNHEHRWRRTNLNTGFSMFEDEQHSAAVEMMTGTDDDDGYHANLLTKSERQQLRELYEALHY